MTTQKRVFIYVRVSTQEQAKEGYSIDEQIKRLKKYCEAHDWIIVKIYTDAGFSGGNTDRPALQEMIEDVKARKGDMVVVYKLDRLSRSQKDTLELIEDVFLVNDVDFVSMNEKFDTSTSFGRAMVGILAVFAQLEREQIKERMSMGREGRAREGKFHGGSSSPIGYDYIDGELVINDYEAMQIRELFSMYLDGASIRFIEKTFNDKGYSHKYGKWKSASIRNILQHKVYIGQVCFAGQYYQGKHTSIVDAKTFEKAHQIYTDRQKSHNMYKRYSGSTTYLGGLIKCAKCTAKYGTTRANGGKHSYYCCYSRRKQNRAMVKDPNCKNKNYRMEILDNTVLDEIKKLSTDPNYVVELKESKITDTDVKKAKIIRDKITSLDNQRSRFMQLYGLGEFEMDELQENIKPLVEQKKSLQKELEALTTSFSDMSKEDVFEIVKDFSGIISRGKFDEIRLMIESLVDYIEINDEKIDIHWKFA